VRNDLGKILENQKLKERSLNMKWPISKRLRLIIYDVLDDLMDDFKRAIFGQNSEIFRSLNSETFERDYSLCFKIGKRNQETINFLRHLL